MAVAESEIASTFDGQKLDNKQYATSFLETTVLGSFSASKVRRPKIELGAQEQTED